MGHGLSLSKSKLAGLIQPKRLREEKYCFFICVDRLSQHFQLEKKNVALLNLYLNLKTYKQINIFQNRSESFTQKYSHRENSQEFRSMEKLCSFLSHA